MNHFSFIFPITLCVHFFLKTAIMGRIVEREPNRYAKDTPYQSTKFNIQIQAVFKKSQDSAATTVRKTVPLIISAKDLECRCPRLKANR